MVPKIFFRFRLLKHQIFIYIKKVLAMKHRLTAFHLATTDGFTPKASKKMFRIKNYVHLRKLNKSSYTLPIGVARLVRYYRSFII